MSLAHSIATARRPLITAADWDRLHQAKFALELRNQAGIAGRNAEIALGSVTSCMAKRDRANAEGDRVWFAGQADMHARRYLGFIELARTDEREADLIERELAAPMMQAAQ